MGNFEVKEPQDFDGTTLAGPEDKGRFVEARAGDHIICPFQCDLCHIRNLKGRDPRGIQDEATAALIRQANLDAFWSRAKGTVAKHRTEVRFQLKYGKELDFDTFPALGPYALGDDRGMRQAVGLLRRTKEPGLKKGQTIKYSTARGVRSTHSEVWKASPDSGLGLVFQGERKRYTATINPTEGIWFNKFMDGVDIRMADITKQDRAVSLPIMHALMDSYEADWREGGDNMELNEIGAALFTTITFCSGMRGYETMWTDLAALRAELAHIELTRDYRGVGWPVVGKFKAEGGGTGRHVIPVAATTSSGLPNLRWARRMVEKMETLGRTTGYLFVNTKTERRAECSLYKASIFDKLGEIQSAQPELIEPECEIDEEFGMQRMFRRGFDTECRNRGVKSEDINSMCRWQVEKRRQGRSSARSMLDLYTDYRLAKDMLLRPSQAL